MKQRVICVMGRVLDQDDGLGVYAENLIRELARLDPDSRYVILLRTPQRADAFRDFDNVRTEVLPARVKTWWDQAVVARAARRLKADIVFNPKFSVPLLSGRASVFVLHGSDWYVNPQNYQWWDNLYIRIMLPLYFRKARRLLAISGCVVDDLARFAGIDTSKVTVSYAAPGAHFVPDPDPEEVSAFRARHRLPERFILSVARAHHTGHGRLPEYPGGNVEGLIRAYQRYRAHGGDLALVVAGRRIGEYLHARGFDGAALGGVQFLGFVPHEEINLAYRAAEFFVLATLYESFAFPLVEAMASGCPAVVPTTGACPEVAGGAACLVDPRNPGELAAAMERLDHSAEERARLREAGLARVTAFSWTRTARRTLEVFDSLAPSGSTPLHGAAHDAPGTSGES